VQAFGHGRVVFRTLAAGPDAVGPDMHVAHRPDGASLDRLDRTAVVRAGVHLRAHLRGELRAGGRLRDEAGFVDGVRERLLAVHVLAGVQGHQRGGRVRVVGRGDENGLDILVIEDAPQVGTELRLREAVAGLGGAFFIHVAEGDDLLARELAQVPCPLAGDADDGDTEPVAGGSALRMGAVAGDPEPDPGDDRALQEVTTRALAGHSTFPPYMPLRHRVGVAPPPTCFD